MWGIFVAGALLIVGSASAGGSAVHRLAVAKCNAKSANSSEIADLPGYLAPIDDPADVVTPIATDDPPTRASVKSDARQDWSIDLGKELDSLAPLGGLKMRDTPVLLLRLENLPNFDPKRHCNRVFPILGKPRIERVSSDTIKASLDRYSVEFSSSSPPGPWWHEKSDNTGRIFWIVPRLFGSRASGPWALTTAYQAAFLAAPPGSIRRSWLAETYLDLSMRVYWDNALAARFPSDQPPLRIELDQRVIQRTNIDCNANATDVFCLSSKLIELNENGTPARRLSKSAFRTSDAVYEGSGLTVGLQQLDIASGDEQAKLLLPKWMPKTIGRAPQYRTKIRNWSIDDLNRWYTNDALVANVELSDLATKNAIIDAFVDRMINRRDFWQARIKTRYSSWSDEWRAVVAMIAIDVENVAGYTLYLPDKATDVCSVLTSSAQATQSVRNNVMYLNHAEISRRYRNAKAIVAATPGLTEIDLSCIQDT